MSVTFPALVFAVRIGEGFVAYEGTNPEYIVSLFWGDDAMYPDDLVVGLLLEGHNVAFDLDPLVAIGRLA